MTELSDGGRHLQSLHQNSLLPLDSDISWPFDETGEVSLWLDVSSNSEVSGSLLEKGCLAGTASRRVALRLDDLLSFNSFLYLQSMTQTRDVSYVWKGLKEFNATGYRGSLALP